MSQLHLLLAYAAAVIVGLTLLAALAGILVGPRLRLLVDRLILLAILALVVVSVVGLPLPLLVGPPRDVLHLLYAVAGPIVLLGGRYLGRAGSLRQRFVFVAIAALALLGVIYRLFTTAGPPA